MVVRYLTVHSAEQPLQCSGFSKFERSEKMYAHVLFDLRQNDDSRVQRAQVESRAGDSDSRLGLESHLSRTKLRLQTWLGLDLEDFRLDLDLRFENNQQQFHVIIIILIITIAINLK